MGTFWQDVRYGLRSLLRVPGFTAVAVLTLALGIGANTAIFSVVRSVLLRPLEYGEPERLIWFLERQPQDDTAPFSAPDFLDYQAQNQTFEQMSGVRPLNFTLTGRGEPERVRGCVVSTNFFSLLGMTPAFGRAFRPEEGQAGAPRVAVISHGFWQRRFGGDANILGQVLTLNEEPVTVIGVMPPAFGFIRSVEMWLNPKRIVPEVFPNFARDHLTMRGMHYMNVIGRLKPGVTLAQAQADIDTIVARLQKQYESNRNHSVRLRTLHDQITGEARPALVVLMVAVGFVLLIGCANLANLLLARATSRQREIAIRTALGAGRGRIVRQLLTESLLLAAFGGVLGVALAYWGVDGLRVFAAGQLPRVGDASVDRLVLAFAAGLSLLTGLLFGIAPALDATRTTVGETLKEGGRTTPGRTRHRLRALLVVGEVALSLVLLVGAGLLTRSMLGLLEVKPGFKPDNLVTMWVSFSSSKYSSGKGRTSADFMRDLLPRLETLPGVQGVAVSNDLPLEGQDTTSNPEAEGRRRPPGEELLMGMHVVNPGYFRAMGIPLLRGRELDARDVASSTPVIVINETAAKQLFGDADPIGKHVGGLFSSEKDPQPEVVGVVGDVRHNGLSEPLSLDGYAPVAQQPWSYLSITLRVPGDPAAHIAAVRKEVLAVDPDMPVFGVRTMEQVMGETLAQRRVTLILTGAFAGMALLLAAIGIYGVMSYGVTQRWHEIGVRVALGAQRGDILRLIVIEGMFLAVIGVLLGVVGALGVTRFLAGLLFGVQPADPLTFAAVMALLALVALAACYLPARRATKVDPMVALRYE